MLGKTLFAVRAFRRKFVIHDGFTAAPIEQAVLVPLRGQLEGQMLRLGLLLESETIRMSPAGNNDYFIPTCARERIGIEAELNVFMIY